jgi:hypothetical protein
MKHTRTPWTALCAAAVLLSAAACTTASDRLSGASVPPEAPALDAAIDAPIDAPVDATALGASDAASDTAAGGAIDPLAARPIPTPAPPKIPIRFSNPANPVDAIGALHSEGVEALWQQRATWTAGGRVDDRKALALTIAWLCRSKTKLPKLPPWDPSPGPTIPIDPCDSRWPALLQALPSQRTLPMAQIYALAGLTAAEQRTVDAILAEQAAGLASNADPSARIAAIIRLEAGLRGGGANPLGAGDMGADASAAGDKVAGSAVTDALAADFAATGGVTDAAGTDGGYDPAAGPPIPTIAPDHWCRPNCWTLTAASVARHSLGYWYAERTSTAAPRWVLLPVTPPARQAAPAATPKPKDWGKIGKEDVKGAIAGGKYGFWGALIGAVLFSAVEGYTQ